MSDNGTSGDAAPEPASNSDFASRVTLGPVVNEDEAQDAHDRMIEHEPEKLLHVARAFAHGAGIRKKKHKRH